MKAFLLDRDGRRPDEPDRLPDLFSLPAALGLSPGRVAVADDSHVRSVCTCGVAPLQVRRIRSEASLFP